MLAQRAVLYVKGCESVTKVIVRGYLMKSNYYLDEMQLVEVSRSCFALKRAASTSFTVKITRSKCELYGVVLDHEERLYYDANGFLLVFQACDVTCLI